MSFPLFKQTIKSNWLLLLFIIALLLMYLTIFISMYDPSGIEGLDAMMEMMPKELISAFGFDVDFSGITGYLAGYFYGFIIIAFPMIYTVITANKLVAKDVDSGSMAYLLVSPNTRIKIVLTRAAYLLISIFLIFLIVFIAGLSSCEAYFPGKLDIGMFALLNLCAMLVSFAVSGISFFFSCIARDVKQSLMFGAGIPILFFFIMMVGDISPDLEWLHNFTIYSLLDGEKILAKDGYTFMSCIISCGITLTAYISGIIAFNKRDLSI